MPNSRFIRPKRLTFQQAGAAQPCAVKSDDRKVMALLVALA